MKFESQKKRKGSHKNTDRSSSCTSISPRNVSISLLHCSGFWCRNQRGRRGSRTINSFCTSEKLLNDLESDASQGALFWVNMEDDRWISTATSHMSRCRDYLIFFSCKSDETSIHKLIRLVVRTKTLLHFHLFLWDHWRRYRRRELTNTHPGTYNSDYLIFSFNTGLLMNSYVCHANEGKAITWSDLLLTRSQIFPTLRWFENNIGVSARVFVPKFASSWSGHYYHSHSLTNECHSKRSCFCCLLWSVSWPAVKILFITIGFNSTVDFFATPVGKMSGIATQSWNHFVKFVIYTRLANQLYQFNPESVPDSDLSRWINVYDDLIAIMMNMHTNLDPSSPIQPSSNGGKKTFLHCNISFQTAGPVPRHAEGYRYRVRSYPLFCNYILTMYSILRDKGFKLRWLWSLCC